MTLEHFRVGSPDSILNALSCLTPPSPILTAEGLLGVCTSGEIPILFDLSMDLDLSPPPPPATGKPSGIDPLPTRTSTTTIGTFGPIRRKITGSDSGSRASWVSWKEATMETNNSQSTPHLGYAPETSNVTGIHGSQCHITGNESTPGSQSLPQYVGIQPTFETSYDGRPSPYSASKIKSPASPIRPTHPPGFPATGLSRHNATHQQFSRRNDRPENSDQPLLHLTVLNGSVIPAPDPMKRLKVSTSNLHWLKDIAVELLIDQEGFRTVKPVLKFSACSEPRSTNGEPGNLEAEMALFKPLVHQNFHFHYAPLEGLPVLRRVTVNGEENKDYISRQASLSLKSNGLYSVGGTESLSHNKELMHQGNDVLRLRWSFEYLIDDRKDVSGRVVGGEKTLTPLDFTCSPMLLHPSQGKRVKLMHIVKKSVAPNIVAEKLRPSPVLRRDMHTDTSPKDAISQSPSCHLHRRAQSQTPGHHRLQTSDDIGVNKLPSRALAPIASNPSTLQNKDFRRRRASSAGEQNQRNFHCAKQEPPDVSSKYYPGKHIVRRSHLAELLDACAENTPPLGHTTSPGIQALTPSPHYYQIRSNRVLKY